MVSLITQYVGSGISWFVRGVRYFAPTWPDAIYVATVLDGTTTMVDEILARWSGDFARAKIGQVAQCVQPSPCIALQVGQPRPIDWRSASFRSQSASVSSYVYPL